MGSAVSHSPVAVALLLITGYYAVVAALQVVRSRRADHVMLGAAVFAGLTTATAIWPRRLRTGERPAREGPAARRRSRRQCSIFISAPGPAMGWVR